MRERLPISSSQARNFFLLSGGMALGIAGPSCLTNHLVPTQKTKGSTVDTQTSGELNSDELFTVVTLSRVVKSSANPAAQFDLIGDGSGGLGSFCNTPAQNGATSCTCEYSYIRTDGSSEKFESNTLYTENDLIRCDYTQLPSEISFVDVRVHIVASDSYSNSITFRFGADSISLNLADASSYVKSQRYQCKEFVTINYLFDPSVYDPVQSIDPEYAYPKNYYTTNMGGAVAFFNRNATPAGGGGFDCPALPNDSAAGMDLSLFSVSSDGGSKQIFPTTGSRTDRHTFYVAKSSSGIFSRPLNTILAPNTVTSTTGDGVNAPGPIGFGANPIPGSSTDTESCPTDVQIPDGYKWAKLWLFRANLKSRIVNDPGKMRAATAVVCNPGAFAGASGTPRPIFTECAESDGAGGFLNADGQLASSSSGSTVLADRVIAGMNTCVHLDQGKFGPRSSTCADNATTSGAGCTTVGPNPSSGQTSGEQKSAFESFGRGTDVWQLTNDSIQCTGNLAKDILNLCTSHADPGSVPADLGPHTPSDLDSGAPKSDFVFVVSPPEVNTKDLKNRTDLGEAYIPYRFYSPSDCLSSDPDFPTSSDDCRIERKITYGLKVTDINDQSDSVGNDPQRSPSFPLCVIQPEPYPQSLSIPP